MSQTEERSLEMELKTFACQNFEMPSDCKNLDQIRFYIRELSMKIEEYKRRFNYVPSIAYTLLAQYNARQNSLVHREVRKSY
jgi:hypothetical protein